MAAAGLAELKTLLGRADRYRTGAVQYGATAYNKKRDALGYPSYVSHRRSQKE